ncbi:GNAT family N-acetyltransferase [Carboxylicivirga marina]|uniref:GNAT family N-acetyltransferase n=1 Tax=Carboxylicivirga marina TaxID=2800988 RepID=UPI002593020E|nr:GNAT family N-acetyltransferase [uncultured Carboxylicivirga sp.]
MTIGRADEMDEQYTFLWTKDPIELKKWDKYLQNDPRGHCQQVSHYLRSFTNYPFFDFTVLVVRTKDGQTVGGIGLVTIGISYFRIVLAPYGPIISGGYEHLVDRVIKTFLLKAKSVKAFYCHINMSVLNKETDGMGLHTLPKCVIGSVLSTSTKGSCFPFVAGTNGFRSILIDYNCRDPYKRLLGTFNKNTQRNIRKAETNKLELRYANKECQVNEAYELIEEIAVLQKYRLRKWNKIKDMILGMQGEGLCKVPCCYYNGELKGALVVWDIGQRLTCVYAGIRRESLDLKVGHFLYNEMLKLSIKKAYQVFDFGVAGSDGVSRFKKGFGAEYIESEGVRSWVFNTFIFRVYKLFKSLFDRL